MMPIGNPTIKVRALDILSNTKNILIDFRLAYFAGGSIRLGILGNKVLFRFTYDSRNKGLVKGYNREKGKKYVVRI